MATQSDQAKKTTRRRRLLIAVLFVALLLLLLIAPGRNAARLLSAAFDEPDDGDAAFVDAPTVGNAGYSGDRVHVATDPGDIDDLAATGDRDHHASVEMIADDLSEDAGAEVDKSLPGGGLPLLPIGLGALHASADGVLNGSTFAPPAGTAAPPAWGGGAISGGGAHPEDSRVPADSNNGTGATPGDTGNGDRDDAPADNTGANPPGTGGDQRIDGGHPGAPGSGGDRGGNAVPPRDTTIVFVPTQDLTGDPNDSGVSGTPGIDGGNLLDRVNDGSDNPPRDHGDTRVPAPVAEPTTLTLLGSGLVVLSRTLRRRNSDRH